MKRVLITGANGQLGQCIKNQSKNTSNIELIYASSKELDITNKEQVAEYFNKNTFDFCINCAAYTNVEQAEKEAKLAMLVNGIGVKQLSEECKKHNVTLTHISTDYVFDGTNTTPYTPLDKTNPINEYGRSKLEGEKFVKTILEKFFIVRTSWLYSEIGRNFFTIITDKLKKGENLSVINDQIGCPTNANDLAKFVLSIIEKDSKAYGIHQFCGNTTMTWYDFAKQIASQMGVSVEITPVKTEHFPTIAKRPKYSVMQNTEI